MPYWIKIVRASFLFLISPLAWGEASRVVTLAPSLSEIVADLLEDSLAPLVGVSEGSLYPPSLKKKPSIGPYHHPNLERIVALKPDLVIATEDGNPKDVVLRLRELKIPTLVVKTPTLESIPSSIEEIALGLGLKGRGEKLASQLRVGLERLGKPRNGSKKKRAVMVVGWNPLVVAGKGSFLDDALRWLQGVNVYEETSQRYPRPSLEDLLSKKPDIVLVALPPSVFSLGHDPVFKKRLNIRYLPVDLTTTPTLRILEGLSMMEKALAN